jgi:hypothetical protein
MSGGTGRVIVAMKTKDWESDAAPSKPEPTSTNHGCLGEIWFDVPVYRLTKEEYELEQKSFVRREISKHGYNAQEMYRRDPKEKEQMEKHLREVCGGCWLFNEIIGFIRLYFLSTQIRGEYWGVDAQRITRTRRKVFRFFELKVTFEEEIPAESTNEEIFNLILKYLERAQNECSLKDRYVDKSVFEYIGRHVDWNGLLQDSSRQTA